MLSFGSEFQYAKGNIAVCSFSFSRHLIVIVIVLWLFVRSIVILAVATKSMQRTDHPSTTRRNQTWAHTSSEDGKIFTSIIIRHARGDAKRDAARVSQACRWARRKRER